MQVKSKVLSFYFTLGALLNISYPFQSFAQLTVTERQQAQDEMTKLLQFHLDPTRGGTINTNTLFQDLASQMTDIEAAQISQYLYDSYYEIAKTDPTKAIDLLHVIEHIREAEKLEN